MIRKLYEPDLPQSDRNRIVQVSVDLTKRKAFKECLGVGPCKGAIEAGHLIPKAWLRRICDDSGHVRAFAKLPVNPFEGDPEQGPDYPGLMHINNTFVGSFTCRNHEEMFCPTDNPDVDLNDIGKLNLLVYKPIIATLWLQRLLLRRAQASLAEVPQSEPFQLESHLQRQRVMGLQYYKRQTEACLSPSTCKRCQGAKCKVIGHKKFEIPGEPSIAVSDFTDGIRTLERIGPPFHSKSNLMNWGVTVLPFHRGHKVIFHHFREEEKIIDPVGELLTPLNGKKLQGQISYWMLKSFENIVIRPERWDRFGKRRREAIVDLFENQTPDIGFGSMEQIERWERNRLKPDLPAHNPNQINLFNPNKQ